MPDRHEARKQEIKTLAAALYGSRPMPEPRNRDIPLLPTGRDERFYLEQFMGAFGVGHNETAIIRDKTGLHDLAVSALMFEDHKTGHSKIAKEGRAPWLLYVADTILDPDEIRLAQGVHGDRSLYLLGRYFVRNATMGVLVVFKEDREVWTGWTGYQTPDATYFESKRRSNSVAIYRRGERDRGRACLSPHPD